MDDHLRAEPGLRHDAEQRRLGRAGAQAPRRLADRDGREDDLDLAGPAGRQDLRTGMGIAQTEAAALDRQRRPDWARTDVGDAPGGRRRGRLRNLGRQKHRLALETDLREEADGGAVPSRPIRPRIIPSSTRSASGSTRQPRPGPSTRPQSEASRDSRPPSASAGAGGRPAPTPMLSRAIRRGGSESGARLHGALSGTSAHAGARGGGCGGRDGGRRRQAGAGRDVCDDQGEADGRHDQEGRDRPATSHAPPPGPPPRWASPEIAPGGGRPRARPAHAAASARRRPSARSTIGAGPPASQGACGSAHAAVSGTKRAIQAAPGS